jgi:DNA mismatch repair ATPase MutS
MGIVVLTTPLPASLFFVLVTLNIALSYQLRERTSGTFDRIEAREGEFQLYAEALERIAERPYAARELRRILKGLTVHGKPAHQWMALLHRGVDLSDVRHSAYLHLPLQALFLWDFHVLLLLEKWQRNAGPSVRGWLAALGRFEALSALAMLRFEQPGWAFPVVDRGADRFEARELGHPLIADGVRVNNDVTVGPLGTVLLVTGSNMSGKSTLLRSIGVNAVLAQAGGPVCAASLRMPPVTLATSILVEDSLAEGISFFMAELKRIQKIVAEADRAHAEGRTLLYLLDEVLRGTNTYERQVAVRRVLLHLLRKGAIGAISTHDLQLAEVEELKPALVPVHFRETLHPGGDPPMTFDYKMRPGVATTVNALKLMELVGLRPEP